ncbi:MAG: hypothetical protein K9H64_03490 [Bacteroidales bacterium]|nr:hypothetical protein [Bacteroidales bacterium]MCF8457418.1 hypothetical protein [Bacteroidales bacterium]
MSKSISIILLSLFFAFQIAAQDKGVNIGVDLASRYIWRGVDYGRAPSIQPTLEFSFGKLQIGAWGAFTTSQFNNDKSKSFVQESDLYIKYDISKAFSLTLTDYFFPDDALSNNSYYNFDKESTGHILEGTVSFNGTEKIPLSLMVATNFYGADAKNTDGDIFYSTYIELGHSTNWKETDLDFFIGGTPNKADTDKKETGFYADSPNVVNIGVTASKEIKVTDKYNIPVSASFITNPNTENVFLVFICSF